MSDAVSQLPEYLKKYVAVQNYDRYTSQDHAAWRYIMRQSRAYFKDHGVSIYAEGLEKTGIPTEHIPRVSEMDDALSKFGWGAVPVTGFIPPAAFLDFQARKVLPIACDMRTVEHIAYTPAPDIVHEAAGHAPILAQPDYANYLCRYATLAKKAIMSLEDIRLYEAIRSLSDVKENPDCTREDIDKAELALQIATENVSFASESARVARMNWWTVEYGLAGTLENPKIYGAGLLSSVGESQNCMSDRVKKIPLTVECAEYTYDITEPQPQLFVTPDMPHLTTVLKELEAQMAYMRGGTEGLMKAKRAKTVTTTILNSGISASGILSEYEDEEFIKFTSPVQLCLEGTQLQGHGIERHPEGFSSPIGKWAGESKSPHLLSDEELNKRGMKVGESTKLNFENGFEVKGKIKSWCREGGNLLYITWVDCHVGRGGKTYFDPAWGEFDMLVGDKVISVHGGPSDHVLYGDYEVGLAASSPGRTSPHTKEELSLFELFKAARKLRDSGTRDTSELESLIATTRKHFSDHWLINLELIEIAHQMKPGNHHQIEGVKEIETFLKNNASFDQTKRWLVDRGLALLTPDSKKKSDLNPFLENLGTSAPIESNSLIH